MILFHLFLLDVKRVSRVEIFLGNMNPWTKVSIDFLIKSKADTSSKKYLEEFQKFLR